MHCEKSETGISGNRVPSYRPRKCIHAGRAATRSLRSIQARNRNHPLPQLARWAQDNFAAIKACQPTLPPTAFNRLADNWRPLFAIAEVAGGGRPQRALTAFNHLATPPSTNGQSEASSQLRTPHSALPIEAAVQFRTPHSALRIQICLLSDTRQIFTQSAATRLSSKQLVDALRALPSTNPQIHSSNNPRPGLTERRLAQQLRPYGIRPRNLRIDGVQAKGYLHEDLREIARRYITKSEIQSLLQE